MNPGSTFLAVFALMGTSTAAVAQTTTPTAAEPLFKLTCQEGSWAGASRSKRACETRELTLSVAAGQPFTVDGGTNGGISIHGWAGPNVRVRAKVQSWSDTEAAAQAQLQAIRLNSQNQTLRAEASAGADPSGAHWAVSYEIFVPQQTALVLRTHNGGISVDNLQADVRFEAVNGGVDLAGLGGQVKGHTVNGGVSVTLTGSRWDGAGLDVETTNGGISWQLPPGYSAQLFTSTNAGSITSTTSLPVSTSGYVHHQVSGPLGQGGAPLRVITVNGGISIKQAAR